MNMLADVRMGLEGFQQLKRKCVVGCGCEPHAFDAGHVCDGRDQSSKIPVVESVRIDVLPQERDLLESPFGDHASFLHDPLWIAGALTPPSVRDLTETAEVVTAYNDGDPSVHSIGSVWYNIVIRFIFRKVDREFFLIDALFLRDHRVADQLW